MFTIGIATGRILSGGGGVSSRGAGAGVVRRVVRTVKTSTVDWKPIRSGKGDLTTLEYQAKTSTLRKFVLGLMFAMPVISFGLGCWQVQRLDWKTKLITRGENALAQPPIEQLPPELDPAVIDQFEYRRFKCKGHFDYSQEIFLGPRIRDGEMGYLVITPFVRSAGGKPILIERGWIHKDKVVPESRKKGYLSHLAFPQGEIEIVALFRSMPKKSGLQFDHKKGERLFHVHDIPEMATQTGSLPIYCQMIYDLSDHIDWKHNNQAIETTATAKSNNYSLLGFLYNTNTNTNKPQLSDEDDDEVLFKNHDDSTLSYQEFEFIAQGVPIAPTPKLKYSNNHLQYLITWFGLSLASTVCLVYSFWKTKQYSTAEKIIAAKRQQMERTFR